MLAFCLAMAFTALCLFSSWDDSPALDEPEHVGAGLCYVETGQGWNNPFHPPLFKALAGYAVSATGPSLPREAWAIRYKRRAWQQLFYQLGNSPQNLIRAARIPSILLLGGFCFAFFQMVRRDAGDDAALWATALLVICPNFVAHGCRVGNDALAAAAAIPALWAFNRYREARGPWVYVLGVSVGLGCLTKFSLLLLFGLLPFMLLGAEGTRARRAVDAGLAALVAVLVIWFGYALWPVPQDYQLLYNRQNLGDTGHPLVALVRATESIPGVRLMSWFGTGVVGQTLHFREGHQRPTLFLGQAHHGGKWSYFPVLLGSKLPCGTLILLALGALGIFGRRRVPGPLLVYTGFAASYLLVACAGGLNLGIRHVLPVLPPLFLVAGWGLTQLQTRRLRLAAGLAYVWTVASVLLAYPGYLAYYNELVGGKAGGPQVAIGSNFDWGVDLSRLARFAQAHPGEPFYTSYFGEPSEAPKFYLGSQYRPVPDERPVAGWVAVSAQWYEQARLAAQGRALPPPGLAEPALPWILELEETGRAGDSILLFDLNQGG